MHTNDFFTLESRPTFSLGTSLYIPLLPRYIHMCSAFLCDACTTNQCLSFSLTLVSAAGDQIRLRIRNRRATKRSARELSSLRVCCFTVLGPSPSSARPHLSEAAHMPQRVSSAATAAWSTGLAAASKAVSSFGQQRAKRWQGWPAPVRRPAHTALLCDTVVVFHVRIQFAAHAVGVADRQYMLSG